MILLLLSTALFCSRGTSVATDNRVVARFNNEVITAGELARALPMPDSSPTVWQKTKREVLDQMMNQALLVQEAKRLGYLDSLAGALEKRRGSILRGELDKRLRGQPVTPAEIARESVLSYTNIHLKLLEVPTLDTALMVQALLKNGVPFESLVVRYSRSKVGGPGGDLGWGPRSRTPPEVAAAIKDLKPGESSNLIFRGIFYDFVKFEGERLTPPESMTMNRDQLRAWAQRRKGVDSAFALRRQVSFDERVLDYLTAEPESVKSSDADLVVARLPDGSKTRVGTLLPIVKGYGNIFPSMRRKALKEDIENDVLEKEARRMKLDKSREYEEQVKRMTSQGLYQYFFEHYISAMATASDSEVLAYFRAHPEQYPPGELTPDVAINIRSLLSVPRQKERHRAVIDELRAKTKITVNEKLLATLEPVTPGKK
jgi:hypothetical protein